MRIIEAELIDGVAFLTAEDSEGFRNTKKAVATAVGFHFVLGRTLAFQSARQREQIIVEAPGCQHFHCWFGRHTERLSWEMWKLKRTNPSAFYDLRDQRP